MAWGDTTRPHFSPSTSRCAPPSRGPAYTSSSASGQWRSSPLGSTLAQWHIPTALLLHFPFSHAPGTRTASCPQAFSSLSKNILLYWCTAVGSTPGRERQTSFTRWRQDRAGTNTRWPLGCRKQQHISRLRCCFGCFPDMYCWYQIVL